MSTSIATSARVMPLALPELPIRVRAATLTDLSFIDGLQKKHTQMVGWMPTKQLEGKIAAGQVLVAEELSRRSEEPPPLPSPGVPGEGVRVGYVIGQDQYFKRDDVGIVYQMNIAPTAQRKLVGATLLKALFDRAAYGCRLFCCWCAQDIAANRFWEAMGFVALAFRTGGLTKGKAKAPRVHIFWQRRIRLGDDVTPYWFPSQTTGGSIREDRLVFPIPPGTHWSDAVPIVLPIAGVTAEVGDQRSEVSRRMAGPRGPREKNAAEKRGAVVQMKRFEFAAPVGALAPGGAKLKPQDAPRQPRRKVKNDPRLVAAARELRDRWLERVNEAGVALPAGKYEVSRPIGVSLQIANATLRLESSVNPRCQTSIIPLPHIDLSVRDATFAWPPRRCHPPRHLAGSVAGG